MFGEIMMALKSIQALANLLSELISVVKQLNLTIEEKQISDYKKEVNSVLEQIKTATSDDDRRKLIVALSRKLSQ